VRALGRVVARAPLGPEKRQAAIKKWPKFVDDFENDLLIPDKLPAIYLLENFYFFLFENRARPRQIVARRIGAEIRLRRDFRAVKDAWLDTHGTSMRSKRENKCKVE
jgi:hypothetical protein